MSLLNKTFTLGLVYHCQELGLDKSYLSLLFAKADNPRKIHLTKAMKGLFYYYFRTKDLENKITP